jgi:hypothetical protein
LPFQFVAIAPWLRDVREPSLVSCARLNRNTSPTVNAFFGGLNYAILARKL